VLAAVVHLPGLVQRGNSHSYLSFPLVRLPGSGLEIHIRSPVCVHKKCRSGRSPWHAGPRKSVVLIERPSSTFKVIEPAGTWRLGRPATLALLERIITATESRAYVHRCMLKIALMGIADFRCVEFAAAPSEQ